jgi:hypothetical protein
MRRIPHTALAVCFLCFAPGLVHAYTTFGTAPDQPTFTCGYTQISGRFEAKVAKYNISGGCLQSLSEKLISWRAKGAHHEGIGFTEETIYLNGTSPYRGQIHFTMICADLRSELDPWVTAVKCGQFKIEVQGEIATQKLLLDVIYQRVQSRGGPLTASFSYDRKPLLAQRQTELQAEVAKAEKEKRVAEQKQQAATQPPSTYREAQSPIVRSPVAGQRFFKQAAVPIKLEPPGSLTIGGYMVKIERKDPTGNWVAQTTLPVGPAQAASAAGYTGFGAGTPPCCLTVPGAYRLSAQVSNPKPSGWSEWVEFVVIEPPASNFNQLKPRTRTFPR